MNDEEWFLPTTPPNLGTPGPRRHRHVWTSSDDGTVCDRCGRIRDDVAARRGKNNRSRGNREELVVARAVGGRKVGPLGHPWDVEMPGYARIQVRKVAHAPSLTAIGLELSRIAQAPGEEMPAYVWVQPGRDGERLIVLRLRDFGDRHGVVVEVVIVDDAIVWFVVIVATCVVVAIGVAIIGVVLAMRD